MMSFELTSGLEAKTYWDDGLSIWLRSYLDLADGTDTTVWLPPTRRHIVTPQTHPADPLAPWLSELGLQPGCAPADLPKWIVDNLATDRLPKSEYELVDPPSEKVVAAMTAQIAKGRCG